MSEAEAIESVTTDYIHSPMMQRFYKIQRDIVALNNSLERDYLALVLPHSIEALQQICQAGTIALEIERETHPTNDEKGVGV